MRMGRLFGFTATVLAGLCFVATYALSQDKPAAQDKAPGGMDEATMKAMMEAGAPGPHHKGLEPMAGKFKYVNKWRMDPSQDWTVSEGDYEGEMGLDGRFLLTTVRGPMMGAEFVGMGCMGYDNVAQKHLSAWIDNMGTGIMRSEGTCDGHCKVITFEGQMLDPMTKKMCKYKYQFDVKSNDEFTMRWWSPDPADGKMFESMTIAYTREK